MSPIERETSTGDTGERLAVAAYEPEAPPAPADAPRVEQLLFLYPDYSARRWVQSMVGWRRKAAEYRQERERLEAVRSAAVRLADAVEAQDHARPVLPLLRQALADFRAVSEGTE